MPRPRLALPGADALRGDAARSTARSSARALACLLLGLAAAAPSPRSAAAQAPARTLSAVVSLGRPAVTGRSASGAELSVELRGADQTVKGSATGNALPLIGFYTLGLTDADGNAVPVGAGDRIRVADAAGPAIEAVVPALRLAADAATDAVTGTAPPGAAISVTVSSGLGFDAQARGAVADAAGSFAVSFAGGYDIAEGSNLRLDVPAAPFTFRLELPLSAQLALRLYDAAVSGVGPNGAVVEAELTRGGRNLARGGGGGAFFGIFGFNLLSAAGEDAPLQPGDLLTLRFVGLSAYDYKVPELDAQADAAADTVSGRAPAGAEVQVTAGAGGGASTLRVVADAGGRYVATFAGQADLLPGSAGQVQLVQRQPGLTVTLSRAWALTRVEALLGSATVSGITAPDAPATLILRSAGGTEKGRAAFAAAAGNGAFQVDLADLLDRPALILPSDRLSFRRGAESFELTIPNLTAEVDIGQDRVSGQAPAGAALAVSARVLFNTQTLAATADAAGRYLADFRGRLDIVGGSRVDVVYSYPEGHRVRLVEAASSIRVWPELGRVDGTVPGGTELTVVALDTLGLPVASAAGMASVLGRYDLTLVTPKGERHLPRAGETIELRFEGLKRTMTVPPLGIDWDTAAETVSGETTPDGTVTVVAQPPEGQGNGAVTRAVAVPPSAFYRADFAPDADLRAGSRLQVTYTYPNGRPGPGHGPGRGGPALQPEAGRRGRPAGHPGRGTDPQPALRAQPGGGCGAALGAAGAGGRQELVAHRHGPAQPHPRPALRGRRRRAHGDGADGPGHGRLAPRLAGGRDGRSGPAGRGRLPGRRRAPLLQPGPAHPPDGLPRHGAGRRGSEPIGGRATPPGAGRRRRGPGHGGGGAGLSGPAARRPARRSAAYHRRATAGGGAGALGRRRGPDGADDGGRPEHGPGHGGQPHHRQGAHPGGLPGPPGHPPGQPPGRLGHPQLHGPG